MVFWLWTLKYNGKFSPTYVSNSENYWCVFWNIKMCQNQLGMSHLYVPLFKHAVYSLSFFLNFWTITNHLQDTSPVPSSKPGISDHHYISPVLQCHNHENWVLWVYFTWLTINSLSISSVCFIHLWCLMQLAIKRYSNCCEMIKKENSVITSQQSPFPVHKCSTAKMVNCLM